MNLSGRTAIVTGASRGLGKAIAARLIADGASVMLTGRDAGVLQAAGEELAAARPDPSQHVVWQAGDVAVQADVEQLVASTVEQLGRVDVLVSNAGVYGPLGLIEEVDWVEWVRAVEINLLGTVLACRSVVPLMRQQGGGKIVILSGGGATSPLPRVSAYAASKAAVVRFGETLAEEVKDAGIDVNAVAPGALNTRLTDQIVAAGPERVGASLHNRAVQWQAGSATPLDVGADLVAFLASPESDGITGRLIAAVWDPWREFPALREKIAASDVFTLRRIVPEDRGWETP
ncbi:MAG: SDR family oxidoreductase [Chloroflexi bacterium]|nr:SDR family oxidoreductase [Chloroflexota bacterium]